MSKDDIQGVVADIIRRIFRCPGAEITRQTSSIDIDGWDSLSHTDLMLEIEQRFGVELPAERMFDLKDVGELVDLIAETPGAHHE